MESPPGAGDARSCFRAGVAGQFTGHDSVLAALGSRSDPEARAWGLLLRAQRWFAVATPKEPFPVMLESLVGFRGGSPEVRRVAGLACAHAVRRAVLAFDIPRLDALMGVHRTLTASDGDRETALWYRVGAQWLELLRGAPGSVPDESGEAEARALGWPALVIEAVALRALAFAELGDLEQATSLARRASRMARTEGLPQPEYLANTVLARVRRLSGKPHLAARILMSLLRVAPWPWHRWMNWEFVLAGGFGKEGGQLAERVRALVESVATGQRESVDAGLASALKQTQGSLVQRDVEHLGVMFDPRRRPADAGLLASWIFGDEDGISPRGLHGVCAAHPERAFRDEPVWVAAFPGQRGRRVLSPALGLMAGVTILLPGKRRRARTDGALSALALAGQRVDELTFFERLYGFAYQPALHQGARDTLYYRMRERLGDHGTFHRAAGSVWLDLERPLALPDSRCSPPPEHSLLAMLAQRGHTSVRDAAAALQIPLRTAQHALKALAADGVCRADRQGRELRYLLEDTTFSEPTTTGSA